MSCTPEYRYGAEIYPLFFTLGTENYLGRWILLGAEVGLLSAPCHPYIPNSVLNAYPYTMQNTR